MECAIISTPAILLPLPDLESVPFFSFLRTLWEVKSLLISDAFTDR